MFLFKQLNAWEGIWVYWVPCIWVNHGMLVIQSNKICGAADKTNSVSLLQLCSWDSPQKWRNHQLGFAGDSFPLGVVQGSPGPSALKWLSVYMCVGAWHREKRLLETFFTWERKNKRRVVDDFALSVCNLTPASFSSTVHMSHRAGCQPRVSLLTWSSPHSASFPQTNPLHREGQNPGQIFMQPPDGVCFSIDPQTMCYYSRGAENCMTRLGLFLC